MQIDLHQPFVGFDGQPIREDGREKMIDETVCLLLFGGSFIKPGGEEEGRQKMRAFELYQKIRRSGGKADLEAEEVALIKQAAVALNPGGYGQVVTLVEGK